MPRLAELSLDAAAPSVREMMQAQEKMFGFVLNPTKLMGWCGTIARGQAALGAGIDAAGNIEPRLRYLVYSFVARMNGCPF